MKILDKITMKNLSFPDIEVQKMELSFQEKVLKIFVEGACLDINGKGLKLNKGMLFFNGWKSLSISKFNHVHENWIEVDISSTEPLNDLCECLFSELEVSLRGFGKITGEWLEWKIIRPKEMYAEFN